MSLLKYFQPSSMLPEPEGRLSTVMPSSSIAAANKEVKQVLDKTDKPKKNSKRGAYEHFIPVDMVATNDPIAARPAVPIQWNLSIMVAHGPEINGCNREVAALKKCLVYGILPIGA